MNKRLTISLYLAAIFISVSMALAVQNYKIKNVNTNLGIQVRKTKAVICQLNALRNRIFKLDDEMQNTDSNIAEHFSNVIEAVIHSIAKIEICKSDNKSWISGAGFVIDADKGYIVTAKHVLDSEYEKVVSINNQHIKIIDTYTDEKEDFAILILDVNDPNYCCGTQLKLSNNVLRRGEFIIAIGHPWIFEYSVSIGIISNPNLEYFDHSEDNELLPRVQFDAAVNPGNSGGVILNWHGDVVGLAVSIYYGDGGPHNAGVNFAVPVSEMKKCLTRFEQWKSDKEFKLQLEEAL